MRVIVLLDKSDNNHYYDDECDVSGMENFPVSDNDGNVIGKVVRCWVDEGNLYAELEVSGPIEELLSHDRSNGAFRSGEGPERQ